MFVECSFVGANRHSSRNTTSAILQSGFHRTRQRQRPEPKRTRTKIRTGTSSRIISRKSVIKYSERERETGQNKSSKGMRTKLYRTRL